MVISIINKNLKIPLYLQLMQEIIKKIDNGFYKENDKLPSKRELCSMYNLSRITVRQALQELEREGYINKVHGVGTFIAPKRYDQPLVKLYSFTEEMKKIGKNPSTKVIEFTTLTIDEHLAKKMNLLPNEDEVNDRSFAMTSSFTSMLLVAYQLFSKKCSIESTYFFADYTSQLLSEIDEVTEDIIKHNFERIVFLGSGSLGKLTREAALKMLELTNGQVASVYESSLGFRHGPKTFLNETTLVVLFISQNPYTKQYDIDILKEIASGTFPVKIVALSDSEDNLSKWADWVIAFNHNDKKLNKEIYFALLNTLFAQTLALKKSIQLGITPDNPVTDGSVNRVVKGVTIYKWKDE